MKKILPFLLLICLSLNFLLPSQLAAEAQEGISPPASYEALAPEANLPSYQAQADLSNLNNLDRFPGFSPDQLARLADQGFLVLAQNPYDDIHLQFHNMYELNEYLHIPNFISVDTALHLYHVFFDNALKKIEEYQLLSDLSTMTEGALNKALALYAETTNPDLQKELGRLVLYYAVPFTLSTGQEALLPEELKSAYQGELSTIEAAASVGKNSLTGKDLNYMLFKPRGHYAGQENLERYFRAMTWYGTLGFPLTEDDGSLNLENVAFSLAASWLLMEDVELGLSAYWERINTITAVFAGNSDDLNLLNMAQVIQLVYGDQPKLADFFAESYQAELAEAVADLPEPAIVGKLSLHETGQGPDIPTQKQFRLMGQRFTLDALVMQELMESIIRPEPTFLDVAAVAGSQAALDLVLADYLQDMSEEDYLKGHNYLREGFNALNLDYWQSNLYNGWLWVLEGLLSFENQDKTGYPSFMQGEAYSYKNLNAAAGNYTELKHDTILYSKQPMAEKGGAMPPKYYYYSYVEPQVEVYNRLIWLVQYSQYQLAAYDLLEGNWEIRGALEQLQSILTLFLEISQKELAGEVISEEENFRLCEIGGQIESLVSSLTGESMTQGQSPALIADVAQIVDVGACLEVATGFPDVIYVVLQRPDNGELYLARGPVYSFYEFVHYGQPLSDGEWKTMMGLEKVEDAYASYYKVKPENFNHDLPPQPAWIELFKDTAASEVTISPWEY